MRSSSSISTVTHTLVHFANPSIGKTLSILTRFEGKYNCKTGVPSVYFFFLGFPSPQGAATSCPASSFQRPQVLHCQNNHLERRRWFILLTPFYHLPSPHYSLVDNLVYSHHTIAFLSPLAPWWGDPESSDLVPAKELGELLGFMSYPRHQEL